MKDLRKARYFLAKFEALSNAAEFIRGHGEEGFSFLDKEFDDVYKKEVKKVAKQLDDRAESFAKKFNQMNVYIDTTIDENY